MSISGRPRAGFSPTRDIDISLVRTDSLDSLSSGGDSDGGPAEPTLAEINLLSASIDARNVEAAKVDETEVAGCAEEAAVATDFILPAGFHRLPSAMRPPVRRGHMRSASAGGNGGHFRGVQRNNSSVAPEAEKQPQSVLKTSRNQHRRVFSHGQITFGNSTATTENDMAPKSGGHRRTASKTDFMLPPEHEERERKKRSSLQRQNSGHEPPAASESSTGSARQRQGSAGFGGHRRLDSLAFSFRHHSRQASRTDSIYTLRGQPGKSGGAKGCKSQFRRMFNRLRREDNLDGLNSGGGEGFGGGASRNRTIVPNHTIPLDVPRDKHPNGGHAGNHIRTTKYTWLSFLPKNLFEQFHRFANVYFLTIVILNWVPAISAFGKEISMLPLIFVLGVTACKDIFEDRRRYLSDNRVNNSTCRVYKSSIGRYVKTLWKDVQVGDMVRLSCNEMIPADILVLRSSDEYGLCYIDTQNLDGEANLKQRQVPRGFVERQASFQPQDFRSTLECDMPSTKIYRFKGTITYPSGERVPVDKDNLLLRECVLKNTDYVEGMVVYAGKESKAMLNNGGPRYKRSKLEVRMNRDILWCVLILIILCLIGAVGTTVWLKSFSEYVPFLGTLTFEETKPVFDGFLIFFTFIIMLQVIIPMSLYVTIEVTKLLQVYLVQNDMKLYDETLDKRVECRALNIPEELGQIQYIFCDKTGTLTENKMVFKRCTIGGQDFAHNSISTSNVPVMATPTGRATIPVNPTLADRLHSMDIQFFMDGKDAKLRPMHPQASLAQDFFLLLAICNTVIVAKHPHRDNMNASGMILNVSKEGGAPTPEPTAPLKPDPSLTPKRPKDKYFFNNPLSPIASSPENSPPSTPVQQASRPKHLQLPGILSKFMSDDHAKKASNSKVTTPMEQLRPIYEAESPDELALVDAAFAYNCKLIKRSPTTAVVSLPGEGVVEFEVLHVFPFDSNRKRMSIILRHPITNERILYCKGADSVIFPRIKTAMVGSEEEDILEKTQNHLNVYAKQGLRVLVMAKRVFTDDEYQAWLELHTEAENSMSMREKLTQDSYNRAEDTLTLIGATGIEDKLQEGVPSTIANLRAAGIVVWVLTGDKQETAINIAYSCKLFTQNMEIITLNARSRDAAEQSIKCHLEAIQRDNETSDPDSFSLPSGEQLMKKEMWTKSEIIEYKKRNRALVVDNRTLVYVLAHQSNLLKPFLDLASHCSSVLGCRTTPLQKAYIVRSVKEELGFHTLAIGDGANDVSMIQTADVGVGISGMEGMQAVMASDFAISRFKYLERLLLVHGHWNYERLSRMVLYFFYKNSAFVFVLFWFQLYAGFSGAVMFDSLYLMLYNLLWTSLPPVAIGVLDQDAPDTVLEAQPRLYVRGRLGYAYMSYSFWLNLLDALCQSVLIFFISFGTYQDTDVGVWEFGTVVITAILLVMSLHLAIDTKSWTIVHMTALALSLFFFFGFLLTYNAICLTCPGLQNPFWVSQHAMGTLHFWLVCLLISVTALIPRVTVKALFNTLRPDVVTRSMLAHTLSAVGKNGSKSSSTSWSRATTHTSSLRSGQFEDSTGGVQLKSFTKFMERKVHPVSMVEIPTIS